MKSTLTLIIAFASLLFTANCGNKTHHDGHTSMIRQTEIVRLDSLILNYNGDLSSIPDSVIPALELYFNMLGLDSDSPDSLIAQLKNSDIYQVFGRDIAQRYSPHLLLQKNWGLP